MQEAKRLIGDDAFYLISSLCFLRNQEMLVFMTQKQLSANDHFYCLKMVKNKNIFSLRFINWFVNLKLSSKDDTWHETHDSQNSTTFCTTMSDITGKKMLVVRISFFKWDVLLYNRLNQLPIRSVWSANKHLFKRKLCVNINNFTPDLLIRTSMHLNISGRLIQIKHPKISRTWVPS